MAFGLRFAGVLALLLVAAVVRAEDAQVPKEGTVLLPSTTNDFSTMVLAIMQRQTAHLAGQDGAQEEGSPINLLATMSTYLEQAQQAFVKMAPPEAIQSFKAATGKDPTTITSTQAFDAVTDAIGNIGPTHPDYIPQEFFNLFTYQPFGDELQAAFNTLPSFPDPLSLYTSNFTGGQYGTPPNGTSTFISVGATLFSYRPCFFIDSENGINIGPTLINVVPRFIQVQPGGIIVQPKLIDINPVFIKVKPYGTNIGPLDINVGPNFISVQPRVQINYPAVPGNSPAPKKAGSTAKAGAKAGATAGNSNAPAGTSNAALPGGATPAVGGTPIAGAGK